MRALPGFLVLLLLMGAGQFAYGQCSRPDQLSGAMRLSPGGTGCVPYSITALRNGVNSSNIRYVFNYDGKDESKATSDSVYIYTRPGTYQILQLSNVNGFPARTCQTVTVYDTVPPAMQLISCGNSLTMTLALPPIAPYDSYEIEWGDGKTERISSGLRVQVIHNYAAANSYLVRARGRYLLTTCGGTATQAFTPGQPPQPPTISRLEPVGTQVRVTVANPGSVLYTLEQQLGSDPFRNVLNGTRATTAQLIAPFDTTQTNCFRLAQTDPCFPAAISPTVCIDPPKPEPTRPTPTTTTTAITWWVPSAFTPNGDVHNNTFGVLGQVDPANYQLTILSRWDAVIYQTNDPAKPWDGTVGGQPAPAGTYGYHIQNGRSGSETGQKSGTLVLIR